MPTRLAADGSAEADARTIVVDRRAEPWRLRCPRGHTDWDRTNAHAWCRACRRAHEAGDDVDPEWYQLHDAKRDELVDYAAIEFVGEW
jgi:hypothetical protein